MPDDPWGPVPDVDPIDELASALVDGEASPEQVARAEEPEVAARVAEFGAIAGRVGASVQRPSDEARDAAIRAALGAAPARPPVSLAVARERRRRVPAWLPAVAAALAVIAGFGFLIASIGGGDSDQESASEDAGTAATTAAAGEEFSTEAEGGGGVAAAPSTAARLPLGSYDTIDALVADLRSGAAQQRAAASESGADDETSVNAADEANALCAAATTGSLVEHFTATVAGDPVDVLVFEEDDGTRRYVVVEITTCEERASGEL